jgi:hypothetical protein
MMNSRFSGRRGFGSWSGELAVWLPVGLHLLDWKGIEQRPDHGPCHAIAAVDDYPHRCDPLRVDVGERGLAKRIADVDTADLARGAGRRTRLASRDDLPQLPDPGVAGQRDRSAPYELGSGVGLRIVRRGTGQAAVHSRAPTVQ